MKSMGWKFYAKRKGYGAKRLLQRDDRVRILLTGLHPGEDIEGKYREFQRKKCFIMAAVFLAGTGTMICMQISSLQGNLKEKTHLTRNEWGEGSYFITLRARMQDTESEIRYRVKERVFSKQEADALYEEMLQRLFESMLGANESLQHVTADLNLVSQIQGFPFSIAWKSSDYEKIRPDGKVFHEEVGNEGEEIRLTAVITYEDYRWEEIFVVRLYPPVLSKQEDLDRKLLEAVEENDSSIPEEGSFLLPAQIEGEEVRWTEKRNSGGLAVLLLCGPLAFLCSYGMERDLMNKNQKRKEEILAGYPEFVTRLRLYMGAGLTIRNAFLRIGKDYRQEKKRTGRRESLYEEVLIAGYQLLNGRSEEEVYREWGRRCETMCCRKLGFLLTSCLRQGNERILEQLDGEVSLAWEERKAKARKKGEEAGTKMLFPMLMLLLMVMFLILLPAFGGFQGV